MVLKTKESTLLGRKYELPGFTILGKRCKWVEEIYEVITLMFLCA